MFHPTVKIERVCPMRNMIEIGEPWYELVVNGKTLLRFETAPVVTAYGSRLTPVASDGAGSENSAEASDTRPAPEL